MTIRNRTIILETQTTKGWRNTTGDGRKALIVKIWFQEEVGNLNEPSNVTENRDKATWYEEGLHNYDSDCAICEENDGNNNNDDKYNRIESRMLSLIIMPGIITTTI